jgi:hypothetical protein
MGEAKLGWTTSGDSLGQWFGSLDELGDYAYVWTVILSRLEWFVASIHINELNQIWMSFHIVHRLNFPANRWTNLLHGYHFHSDGQTISFSTSLLNLSKVTFA